MNKHFLYNMAAWVTCCILTTALFSFKKEPDKPGILKIKFINTANGKPIMLRDSVYTNAFGEQYTISKLKYYISNISVPNGTVAAETDPYHLINAADTVSEYQLTLNPGVYKGIHFFLGMDSAANCSGAQAGALDPANDMFWTWNSGYVIFKLEGTSPASTGDLERIEHHIGGYKGENNVTTPININFPEEQLCHIRAGKITELVIEANMDHYWQGAADIKISELALIMTPGPLSKKIASNFKDLFSVKSVKEGQ